MADARFGIIPDDQAPGTPLTPGLGTAPNADLLRQCSSLLYEEPRAEDDVHVRPRRRFQGGHEVWYGACTLDRRLRRNVPSRACSLPPRTSLVLA